MRTLRASLFVLLFPAAALAQVPGRAAFDSAALAWDEGRFEEALARMDRLLAGPGAERWRDTIALLTGERYVTTPVAPHGNRVLWSPDGRWVVVEHGARWQAMGAEGRLVPLAGDSTPRLTLLRLEGDSLVRDFEGAGWGAAFLGGSGRLAWLEGAPGLARILVREAAAGAVRAVPAAGMAALAVSDMGDGRRVLVTTMARGQDAQSELLAVDPDSGGADTIAAGPGSKAVVRAVRGGAWVVYRVGTDRVVVRDPTGTVRRFAGLYPTVSADGSTLAWLFRDANGYAVGVLRLEPDAQPLVAKRTPLPLRELALASDGRRVAFAMMVREDWEVIAIGADGSDERRLTTDIQHDYPEAYLADDLLLVRTGERRHARTSLVGDGAGGGAHRLFHNNSVRTVAMEYGWEASPDGRRLLVIADREGDPYTPERGVYLLDRGRPVTLDAVRARVRQGLASERALLARGRRLYAPIRAAAGAATREISVTRIRRHAEALARFGSRHIRMPGNRQAIDYLVTELRAMGYVPEVQAFEPQPGVPSSNVWVTIRGRSYPDSVVVVSSHLDSEDVSPGADDNGSGTCALLEIARVMRTRPQAATVVLLWVTGEEEGLLGSRDWVRRAKAAGMRVVANLNNDTFGWTRHGRLEATVRYSNPAFRDIEHGAAQLFTDLVTFEARMFQSSDGAAFFDGYGDLVGGFGSYPILASPHYHQSHDAVETVNLRNVAEVAKATLASLMYLASRPSPLR